MDNGEARIGRIGKNKKRNEKFKIEKKREKRRCRYVKR